MYGPYRKLIYFYLNSCLSYQCLKVNWIIIIIIIIIVILIIIIIIINNNNSLNVLTPFGSL